MDNKVRLNAQKRQALKKEWANTVYNKTPMQVDDDLQDAVSNYYEVKNKTWDSVISPLVEQFYPTADMQVIRKYETSTYRAMTTTDHCFVFKNIDSVSYLILYLFQDNSVLVQVRMPERWL